MKVRQAERFLKRMRKYTVEEKWLEIRARRRRMPEHHVLRIRLFPIGYTIASEALPLIQNRYSNAFMQFFCCLENNLMAHLLIT